MIKARCPICGKEEQVQDLRQWPEAPFCSPRCRTIDLGRWLGGDYRIPADEEGSDPEGTPDAEHP